MKSITKLMKMTLSYFNTLMESYYSTWRKDLRGQSVSKSFMCEEASFAGKNKIMALPLKIIFMTKRVLVFLFISK